MAYKAIVALHQTKIIEIKKTIYADKAFTFVLNSFHPKSKRRHPTDHSLKLFTQEIFHVFHLFVFIRRSFCFHRSSFSFAAVFALLFHFLVNIKFVLYYLLKNAMYHYVRIATNG